MTRFAPSYAFFVGTILLGCNTQLGSGPPSVNPGLDAAVIDASRDGSTTFDAHLPDFGMPDMGPVDLGTPDGLPPTVNAGPDVTIRWPLTRATMAAVGSDTGGPVSYSWQQLSGPTQSIVRNGWAPDAIVTSLRVGTYAMRVTVTDNEGLTATDDVTISVGDAEASPGNLPEWILSKTSPVFRRERNLPPLSIGAFVGDDTNIAFAERYRYALHIGDLSSYYADMATSYTARMQRFIELAAADPEIYALATYVTGYIGFYDCDRMNRILAMYPTFAMHHSDGSIWSVGTDGCFAFNAAATADLDDAWIAFANDAGVPDNARAIVAAVESHGAHISVVNDIGEWGLDYPSIGEAHWSDPSWHMWMLSTAFWDDATVAATWGPMPAVGDWGEAPIEAAHLGESLAKATANGAISSLLTDILHPDLYTFYLAGPAPHLGRFNEWRQVAWDFPTMRSHHVNFPDAVYSMQMYFGDNGEGGLGVAWTSSNSQSTGTGDQLGRSADHFTHALASAANGIAAGSPFAYTYVAGRGLHAATYADPEELTGYLKAYYALVNIGGPYFSVDLQADVGAGHTEPAFAMPSEPPYLPTMVAYGEVHALYSHLEEFIYDGAVLPNAHGDTHPFTHWLDTPFALYEQYAYPVGAAFHGPHDASPTYDASVRVVARKRNSADEWLVAGWVAGGEDRDVDVELPAPLGRTTLHFRRSGCVYRIARDGGATISTLVDIDGMRPTDHMLETD